MQLNLFLKRGKREFLQNPNNFFNLRTVPLKYGIFRALIDLRTVPLKHGTFRVYHPMKSTEVRHERKKIFCYITLVCYSKFLKYAMFQFQTYRTVLLSLLCDDYFLVLDLRLDINENIVKRVCIIPIDVAHKTFSLPNCARVEICLS